MPAYKIQPAQKRHRRKRNPFSLPSTLPQLSAGINYVGTCYCGSAIGITVTLNTLANLRVHGGIATYPKDTPGGEPVIRKTMTGRCRSCSMTYQIPPD